MFLTFLAVVYRTSLVFIKQRPSHVWIFCDILMVILISKWSIHIIYNSSINVSMASTWCLPLSLRSWLKHLIKGSFIICSFAVIPKVSHSWCYTFETCMQTWRGDKRGTSVVWEIVHYFVCICNLLPYCFFLHCHYNSATMEMKSKRHHSYQVGGNKHTHTHAADEHSLMRWLSHWRQH